MIAAPAECAALVPSVSYGIAAAARNLPLHVGENLVVIGQSIRRTTTAGTGSRTSTGPNFAAFAQRAPHLHATRDAMDRFIEALQAVAA